MSDSNVSSWLQGRYELLSLRVKQGTRRAWHAMDHLLNRPVFIKGVLGNDEEEVLELRQEFNHLCLRCHPGIVHPYDLGFVECVEGPSNTLTFFTQEFISGSALTELKAALSPERLQQHLVEALEMLASLQSKRLCGLDIKPDHLIVSPQGLRWIDLDLARADDPFRRGELRGTFKYLAPELLTGSPASLRSDLYSLGMSFWEVAAGHLSELQGDTVEAIAAQLVRTTQPDLPLALQHSHPALSNLLHQLTAGDPLQRPMDAEDALHRLTGTSGNCWRRRVPPPETPIVGQQELFHQLSTRFQVPATQAGLVYVVGPSGSGKSRLLADIAYHLQTSGLPALRLSTRSQRIHEPLAKTVLRHLLLLTSRAERLQDAAPHAQDLASVENREYTIRLLAEQILEAAHVALAQQHIRIPILVDDADGLDEITAAVITRLKPLLPQSGLCWINAHTQAAPPGPSNAPPPPTQSAAHPDHNGSNTLHLVGLTIDEVRTLAESMLGPTALHSRHELMELFQQSQGLPGLVRSALLPRWLSPNAALRAPLAMNANPSIDLQLEGHSPNAKRLALQTSVLKVPLTHRILRRYAVSETSGEVRELVRAGVWTTIQGTGDTGFCFSDETLRMGLESTLSPEEQQSLHLRAGEALESQQQWLPDSYADAIGHHFLAAGQLARARRYLLEAHTIAVKNGYVLQAINLLKALIHSVPDDDVDLPEYYLLLAKLELDSTHFDAAVDAYQKVISSTDRVADAPVSRAQLGAGIARARQRRYGDAIHFIKGALSADTPVPLTTDERRNALQMLAWAQKELGELANSERSLQEVRQLGLPENSRQQIVQLHLEVGLHLLHSPIPDKRWIQELRSAISLAQSLQYEQGQISILNALLEVYRRLQLREEAHKTVMTLITLAHGALDVAREAGAIHNLGVQQREDGDIPGALQQFERAAQLYRLCGASFAEAMNRLEAAELLLENGAIERAQEELLRLEYLQTLPGETHRRPQLCHQLLQLRLAMRSGQVEGLDTQLEALQAALSVAHEWSLEQIVTIDRVELSILRQQPREALTLASGLPLLVQAHGRALLSPEYKTRLHRLLAEAHRQLATRDVSAGTIAPAASTLEHRSSPAPTSIQTSIQTTETDAMVWLERIKRVLAFADEEVQLARELAIIVGEVYHGRGMVILMDGSELARQTYGISQADAEDLDRTVIEQVRLSKTHRLVHDVVADPKLRSVDSLRKSGARSIACWPILWRGNCIGVVYIDHHEPGRFSSPQTCAVIEAFALLASDLYATLASRREPPKHTPHDLGLVGNSAPMRKLQEDLQLFIDAKQPYRLLLLGETGTGKTYIANSLHAKGNRRKGPFVDKNCALFTPESFEANMMGVSKGTFTGVQEKAGWFESAHRGTLFLDEIGYMPLNLQRGLLKIIDEHRGHRLGSEESFEVDINLICATSRDLAMEARDGRFLTELLRRINVNRLTIPSLQERGRDDIHLLAQSFVTRLLQEHGAVPAQSPYVELERYMTNSAREALYTYSWPGNVGELRNLFDDLRIRDVLYSERTPRPRIDQALVMGVLEYMGRTVQLSANKNEHPGLRPPLTPPAYRREKLFQVTLTERMTYRQILQQFKQVKEELVLHTFEQLKSVKRVAEHLQISRDLVYKLLPGSRHPKGDGAEEL